MAPWRLLQPLLGLRDFTPAPTPSHPIPKMCLLNSLWLLVALQIKSSLLFQGPTRPWRTCPIPAFSSPLSPCSSLCSSHTGLLAVLPTRQAQSSPRTFAQAVPHAWKTFPNAALFSSFRNTLSCLPFSPLAACLMLSYLFTCLCTSVLVTAGSPGPGTGLRTQ